MNLIRKYKISKITNSGLTNTEIEIINLFRFWFSDLVIIDAWKNKYPSNIFYMKKDLNIVLDYSFSSDTHVLWVRNFNLWQTLKKTYQLKEKEIIELVNFFVREQIPFFKDKKFLIAEAEGITFISLSIDLKNEVDESNQKI